MNIEFLSKNENKPLIFISLLCLWFAFRGYDGVIHDAIIYLFQAIAFENEALNNAELLTKYFDQGKFSIFTSLHYFFIIHVDNYLGTFLLYIISHLIYFCVIFFCLDNHISDRRTWFLMIIGLLVADGFYLNQVFRINETFLTSRILAEAFSIAAFGFFFKNKYFYCLLFSSLSVLIHPIIGIWCFVIFTNYYLYLILGQKKWFVTFIISSLFLLIGALLLETSMSIDWFEYALKKNYLFPLQWELPIWDRYFQQLIICLGGYFYINSKKIKTIILILLILSISCLIINIAGELYKNNLIVKLQFWRVNYITYITAILFSSYYVACNLLKKEKFLLVFLIFFSWVTRDISGSFLALIWFVLNSINQYDLKNLSYKIYSFKWFLLFLLLFPYGIDLYYLLDYEIYNSLYAAQFWEENSSVIFLLLLAVFLLFLGKSKLFIFTMIFSLFTIFVHYFFLVSIYEKDKMLMASNLASYIKQDETVFWKNRELEVMLYLERANYYSSDQLVPIIFSEKLFDEGVRRYDHLRKSGVNKFFSDNYHFYIQFKENNSIDYDNNEDNVNFNYLCSDKELDYFIFPSNKIDDNKNFIYKFFYKKIYWKIFSCEKFR